MYVFVHLERKYVLCLFDYALLVARFIGSRFYMHSPSINVVSFNWLFFSEKIYHFIYNYYKDDCYAGEKKSSRKMDIQRAAHLMWARSSF